MNLRRRKAQPSKIGSAAEASCPRLQGPDTANVTFCEKGGTREPMDKLIFLPQAKNKPEQSGLCSDVSTGYEKDPLMVVLYNKKQPATHYELPTADLVPLTGLEPVRCCQRGIFSPLHVAIAARKALWSGLSLHPRRILRCAPSSLYTFPEWSGLRSALSRADGSFTEFDAIHTDGFPVRCSNFKSLVSADSTTAA